MPPDSFANGYEFGLPVAQAFYIFDTDKTYQGTIKVETQKDSFEDLVVYWTDIMHLHENAIYLKDNNGIVANFVKSRSGETRVPLRVLYSPDPLTIIVHKAPLDHVIVPLSKGLRIEPERTLSASTRIRKKLYRALFRTNSDPVAPMASTGAHHFHRTSTTVAEKIEDGQLVKVPEAVNETMPLPPTTHAPPPLAPQIASKLDASTSHSILEERPLVESRKSMVASVTATPGFESTATNKTHGLHNQDNKMQEIVQHGLNVDQIITTYSEHGRALKDLGRDSEANVSYDKSDELRSNLLAKEALVSAKASLENARSAQGRDRALKYCKKAKTALRRIDISAVTTDQSALEQIIVAFREHGRVLVALNESKKAQKSFNKAKELDSQPALSSSTNDTITSKSSGQNSEIIPATIFAKDSNRYAFEGSLPGPDKRLDNARQLAYCLGLLLQDPAELDDTLDADTRTWLQATRENTDEQKRLKTLARDLLREFPREELKDETAVAEVVCLAPVFEMQEFRFLLGQFVDNFSSSVLLNIRALDGLDYVVQSAPQGGIDADDLVKILEHINSRIEHTHSDSLDYIYRLTIVVSHILDAMVLGDVHGLNRVSLHTPLKVYLQNLMKSADPYLAFQAAYASQALLWISNDEELWKAVLRRTGTVAMGVGRLARATKALNIVEFINGLSNIQEGLEDAGEYFGLVANAHRAVTELRKGGQDFQVLIKEGFSFSRKQEWYPVLRATDISLRDGEFTKFKSLVCDAPCRGDLAFQWGVCQRLGNVAADPQWDLDTRQDALAFLGQIYRNDTVWGENVLVKQCILDILMQLASAPRIAMQ
ncbi:hypothetical protein BGZ99_010266, partial [Dissophora globulifera]